MGCNPLSRSLLAPLCAGVAVVVGSACRPAPEPDARASQPGDIRLVPDSTRIRGVVPRNTTLDALLRAQGIASGAVHQLISVARPVFDPRRLRSSQPFSVVRTLDGALRLFEYEIDNDKVLRVSADVLSPGALRAEIVPIPKTLEHGRVSGTIGGDTPSLYQAMDAAGEQPELTIAMAEIFAGEIDFNTELQPDDRFAVAFERYVRDGRPNSYGTISAAEFVNDGRVLRAIRFTPPGGKADYFDEQGRSLRRFFLRSPLKFEPRITSRFNPSRRHPVLNTIRAHRGVDFAAPTGAPVVAIASGTVLSVTTDRVNGRMVKLRHASGYETNYLHLSAFAPGLRAGRHVAQGELIGRVGSTGLATGPHLHYALKKNGVFVDPIREHRNLPPGDPVPASAMDAFSEARDQALRDLAAAAGAPEAVTASR
ncbi:MAG: M23 family metallopeptidase [Vicinamibacterales bacterium]